MSRTARKRPTLADLEQDGPALSPADLAHILGISREVIGIMCRTHEIPAFAAGNGETLRHWKIPRRWARDYCRRMIRKPSAA